MRWPNHSILYISLHSIYYVLHYTLRYIFAMSQKRPFKLRRNIFNIVGSFFLFFGAVADLKRQSKIFFFIFKVFETVCLRQSLINQTFCVYWFDLNSSSHKRFCSRLLTLQGTLLGHGESKKSCLNVCRNRNFSTSRDGIRTHDLRMTVVVEKQKLFTLINNIGIAFTKTFLH